MDICPTSATRLPIIGFDDLTPAQLRRLDRIFLPKRIDFTPLPPTRTTFEHLDHAVIADIQLSADRSTPRGGMGGRA